MLTPLRKSIRPGVPFRFHDDQNRTIAFCALEPGDPLPDAAGLSADQVIGVYRGTGYADNWYRRDGEHVRLILRYQEPNDDRPPEPGKADTTPPSPRPLEGTVIAGMVLDRPDDE